MSKLKELKKQTPDFKKSVWDKDNNLVSEQVGIRKKDLIQTNGIVISLVSNKPLDGQFYFDCYDSSNETYYISDSESGSMTYNVPLNSISRVPTWKDTIPNRN